MRGRSTAALPPGGTRVQCCHVFIERGRPQGGCPIVGRAGSGGPDRGPARSLTSVSRLRSAVWRLLPVAPRASSAVVTVTRSASHTLFIVSQHIQTKEFWSNILNGKGKSAKKQRLGPIPHLRDPAAARGGGGGRARACCVGLRRHATCLMRARVRAPRISRRSVWGAGIEPPRGGGRAGVLKIRKQKTRGARGPPGPAPPLGVWE